MSAEPVSDERLRQAVRDVLAEELDQDGDQPSATRRQVLGSIVAGGVLGGLAGAGSAAGATGGEDTSAMAGALAGPPYKVADPGLYSGPASAASSISNSVGQVHLAQDTGETLYDDGGSFGPLDRAAPNLQSKERPVVDVTHPDFGAVGDGSTDDQAAIQAAIDHAATIAPAVVHIPPGRYVVDDPSDSGSALRWSDDIILEGSGMFSTILDDRFTQGGGTATGEPRFIYAGGTDSTQGSRIGVRNLGIENFQGFDANTISLEEFNEGFVENVFIDNTSDVRDPDDSNPTGLPISLGFDEQTVVNRNGWVSGCILRNDVSANKTIEIAGTRRAAITGNVIEGFGNANGVAAVSCERVSVTGNSMKLPTGGGQPAIQALGSRSITVTGNSCRGATDGLVCGSGTSDSRAFDVEKVLAVGNEFDRPSGAGIDIDTPMARGVFNSNLIYQPGNDGINVAVKAALQINGNQIYQPGRHGVMTDNGAAEFTQSTVVGNSVIGPADIGLVIARPNTDGGVIALNNVNNVQQSVPHIEIRNTGGDPNNFVLLGNNCSRGGTGINVQGTPSSFVQADNNT